MWFLLFACGAFAVDLIAGPALRRLMPEAPPAELLLGLYFLATALLRLLIMRARLAAYERKARRLARRTSDPARPSTLGAIGVGVGQGALQAVGGDVVGASLSLLGALLRGAAGSVHEPPPPQRERRRAAARERRRTAASIVGVGLCCVGLAWRPLLATRVQRAAAAAIAAAGLDR